MSAGPLKTLAAAAVLLCAAALPARPQAAVLPDFGTVGEGFTSPNRVEKIRTEYRVFSLPNFNKTCQESKPPFRLASQNRLVTLRVGEWFPLIRLIVVGEDRRGNVLRPLPIMIEVERKEPPLLNLRTDMISDGRLLPIRTGRFRFRARTICEGTAADVLIQAVVRPK
jgi:hypothetical protein